VAGDGGEWFVTDAEIECIGAAGTVHGQTIRRAAHRTVVDER